MKSTLKRIYRRVRYGEPIVIVSGLPRSGTSMAMKMLQAGGMQTTADGIRTADEDNPEGYFEDERVKDLAEMEDKDWLKDSRGKAIKVIANDLLYLVSDGGILRCYDAHTGDALWETRVRRSHNASLVVGDGKLFATSEQGDIHVFDATDDHKLLAINRLQQRCLATPAIGRDELFVRTDQRLYCFAAPLDTASESTAATSDASARITPASTSHGSGE